MTDELSVSKSAPTLNKQASSIKYNELFNTRSRVDLLETEGEYGFDFKVIKSNPRWHPEPEVDPKSPLISPNDHPIAGEDTTFDQTQIQEELTLIYSKFFCCTLLIVFLCGMVFAAGIYHWEGDGPWYNWNGISFHTFVLIVGLYGVFIHLCIRDGNYTINKHKLKHLLVYFILAFFCIVVVFGIAMIYAVLLPIHVAQNEEFVDGVVAAVAIFGVFGVIFWTIFILFYIDICARACLKRGRLNFVVVEIDSRFWNLLYRFVISFRIQFRVMRRFLTAVTGMRFIRGIPKFSAQSVGKLHEEQRALEVLQHDEYERLEADLQVGASRCKRFLVKCFCCPCLVMASLCETVCDTSDGSEIMRNIVCGILFTIIFPQLALWMLFTLCLAVPCLMNCVQKELWFLALLAAAPCVYLAWYTSYGICPNNLFNTDKFPKTWDWTMQCIIWDYACIILLAMGGDD